MKLRDLLSGLDYKLYGTDGAAEIESVCSDSRSARKKGLFICIKGTRRDGHDYARRAAEKGSVILSERKIDGLPCVVTADTRLACAVVNSNFYNAPQNAMRMVAVTGTNGKTSVSYYLRSILRCAGLKVGMIGTLGIFAEDEDITSPQSETEDIPSAMTTPDPACIYRSLKQMKEQGIDAVVMEASSHAILQKKLEPINFEVGVFTNLSPEHLDLHGSMENYFKTKASLFTHCKRAVINTSGIYGSRLAKMCEDVVRVAQDNADNSAFDFTLENTMLASAAAAAMGIDDIYIKKGIENVDVIPGRMEKVPLPTGVCFDAYIDYAHTPYAMERVLRSVCFRSMGRKITVVFGCGGDRDKSKRPEMGRIAAMYADKVIVTGDNPRTEDPMAIIGDILSGISVRDGVVVEPDRRSAVERAVTEAEEGEIILLLGKGHEKYEINITGKHSFSEAAILRECAERRAK